MFVATLFEKTNKCDILSQIDKKLSEKGEKVYHKYAFGVKNCKNTDDSLILSDLRDILVAKLNGHDCFRHTPQNQIENIIKRYLI